MRKYLSWMVVAGWTVVGAFMGMVMTGNPDSNLPLAPTHVVVAFASVGAAAGFGIGLLFRKLFKVFLDTFIPPKTNKEGQHG